VIENKRDLSISMAHANVIVLFIMVPVAILQIVVFSFVHGAGTMNSTSNFLLLFIFILMGVVVHELIHGVTWMVFGHKPLSDIKVGFQLKNLTPYAHLKEPVEVNAYRIGAFMPGLILGIIVYIFSIFLGNADLFWFSLVHTCASAGDWLILWLIRKVKSDTLVEDHPNNAGCYVIEP
jgi:hypothetical protein